MSEVQIETKFLFDKVRKLYPTFVMPDELDIDCWREVLAGKSQDTILAALKAYRKTVEYNQAPTPGTFAKFLREEAPVVVRDDLDTMLDSEEDWRAFLRTDPALAYYKRDCEILPSDQVHALMFYRRVLADVIAVNVDTLPNARKMSYSEKVAIVLRNNWLDDITEQVAHLARESEGYNPHSVNQAVNALASHWRAGA